MKRYLSIAEADNPTVALPYCSLCRTEIILSTLILIRKIASTAMILPLPIPDSALVLRCHPNWKAALKVSTDDFHF